MSQSNLRKQATQCEVVMENNWDRLTIDFNPDCCRIVDQANYIKAECFSPKGNKKFRVRIEIESVADDEVSRPQEKIQTVFQYDSHCAMCQSNVRHVEHFYTTLSNEKANKEIFDYVSCEHIWKTDGTGVPYCQKCGNVKLTRKVNADSSYSK